jgi:hypothetical protein
MTYAIRPIPNMTFARFRPGVRACTMHGMDTFGMVILAICALAFLELAAVNLRGEERHARQRRPAPVRR